MTDPAAIAARLTEAQKRALRQLAAETSAFMATLVIKDARRMLGSLEKLAITRRDKDYPDVHYLTPLGRAVLAELDKEPPK